MQFPRGLVVAAVAAGLVVATFLSWLVLSTKPKVLWPRERFSSQVWLDSPKEQRYRFVKDLLDNNPLAGRSKTEVGQILGPPTTEYGGRFTTYTVAHPADFALVLDSVYFVRIEFDSQGMFVRATLDSD
jgi:hypothetical protein